MVEKESSRDKLLSTASRLFQLQGYHGTGLNQITKESGAPKGSLYHYFPNGKEELAIEAVKLTSAFVSKNIKESLKQIEDPVIAIQNFIETMALRFENERSMVGVPIAAVALETSHSSELLRKACQEAYESFQNEFTQKLINSGFDQQKASELGIVINSLIEGAFLLSFTRGDSKPLLLIAKQIPVLLS
ncbi:TetR/AcrR family transcriptional regulator [Bacillus sp. 1NLA3E]|uniref:TetR/AcrR family transcriptional regulator n=1 Tax=Bacillus sp. 1NLA3E TaxID=666686 RepID=UPI000247EAAF|nr:TetR/AcrR family transcriptional regulator [Bacillus sp. 1NLA3E]AGK53374.1 TetR family transcriptional regulator [Bacillus sp. 1NLA3E]